jgi:hypothetical protein
LITSVKFWEASKYAKHEGIRAGALIVCSIVIKNSHIDYTKGFPTIFREAFCIIEEVKHEESYQLFSRKRIV